VAHDLVRDVSAVLFQMNGHTAIKESRLRGNNVQLVGRPEGTNHSDPQEDGCSRRQRWIEVSLNQVPGMSHGVKRGSTAL